MAYDKVYGLKETLYTLPPPKFFERTWKDQVRQMYPDGIDKTLKCVNKTTDMPSFEQSHAEMQLNRHKVKIVKYKHAERVHKDQLRANKSLVHDLIGLGAKPISEVLESNKLKPRVSL